MSDTRSEPVLTVGQLKTMLASYPDDAEVILHRHDDYSQFRNGVELTVSLVDEYLGLDRNSNSAAFGGYTLGNYLDYALHTDVWRRIVQCAQSADYEYLRAHEVSIRRELYYSVRDATCKKVLITIDGV